MHNKSKKRDAKKLNRVFSQPLFLCILKAAGLTEKDAHNKALTNFSQFYHVPNIVYTYNDS